MTPNDQGVQFLLALLGADATFGDHIWSVGLMKVPFNVGDNLDDPAFAGGEADGSGYAQIDIVAAAITYTIDPVSKDYQLVFPPPAGGWAFGSPLTPPGTCYGFFAVPLAAGAWNPGDNTGQQVWAEPFDTPIEILSVSDLIVIPEVRIRVNQFSFR